MDENAADVMRLQGELSEARGRINVLREEKLAMEARLHQIKERVRYLEAKNSERIMEAATAAQAQIGETSEPPVSQATGGPDRLGIRKAPPEPQTALERAAFAVLYSIGWNVGSGGATIRRMARRFLGGSEPKFIAATRHKIAELERSQAALTRERDEARAQVAALRAALEACVAPGPHSVTCAKCAAGLCFDYDSLMERAHKLTDGALAATAAAAREHDERIRHEEWEAIATALKFPFPGNINREGLIAYVQGVDGNGGMLKGCEERSRRETFAATREAAADVCDQHNSCEGIAERCAAAIRALTLADIGRGDASR